MPHPLESLIDQIIQNAEKRGDFDNLPGAGKPIKYAEAQQDAVLNRLLWDAEATSPVVVLRRQILAAQAHLKTLVTKDDIKAQMFVLSELNMKLAIEMEAFRKYG